MTWFWKARNNSEQVIVSPDDPLPITGAVSLDVSSVEIGEVVIKDATSSNAAAVLSAGRLSVDGSGVTQPVSAASLPLPSGASTAANQATALSSLSDIDTNTANSASDLSAIQALLNGTGTIGIVGSLPAGTNIIGKVQQSGSWTVAITGAIPGGTNSIGAVTQGGSWTVGISNGAMVGLNAGSQVIGSVSQNGTWTVTQSGTWTVQAAQSGTWNIVLGAGSNIIGKVGIDQSTPGTTNAVYDTANKWGDPANRTYWSLSAILVTGATSETLLNMASNTAGSAGGPATSYTVPAGKNLWIQTMEVDVLNTTTVANRVQANLRALPSGGTLTASSPLVARCVADSQAALAASGGANEILFPEGIIFPTGSVVGVSQICSVTTASIVSVVLTGFLF